MDASPEPLWLFNLFTTHGLDHKKWLALRKTEMGSWKSFISLWMSQKQKQENI